MTFHIYRRELRNERDILTLTDEEFRLAGNNLIHRAPGCSEASQFWKDGVYRRMN